MSRYRRAKLKGGTYFFTVNLMKRGTHTLTDNIDMLRISYGAMRAKHPFHCDAIVILPDHLHAVWTLPEDDCDFSKRWQLFKTGFSRSLPIAHNRSYSKREKGIWQRRFWEHLICDEEDYNHHIEYCWNNPVKHRFVKEARDWPYSSYTKRSWLKPTRINT